MKIQNLNKKKIGLIAVLSICLIVIIIIAVLFLCNEKNIDTTVNKKDNKLQKKLLSYVTEITNEENGEKKYKIRFKGLKEINPDTIAYLKVDNTNINYVVVQGTDNSYYLNHDFEKKDNSSGWIFSDYRNKFNHTDYNTVIYGNNTKNDDMFGALEKTLKKEWYNDENSKYITLVTDDSVEKYEIFSIYKETDGEYATTVDFTDDIEYLDFLDTVKLKSIKDFNVEVNSIRGIITLVACSSNGSDRIVVHAVNVF